MKLVFATNNRHKLEEIKGLSGTGLELLTPLDIGCKEEIPEDQSTLEGNARQKAMFIFKNYGYPCFADDTGLEIDSLNGEPGVRSARYAGPGHDSQANMEKVLERLKGEGDRKARFRTVISLITDEGEWLFEGVAEGEIIDEKRGVDGFGYDPIFLPDGSSKTFAEMELEEKNKISHRAKAIAKLVQFLNSYGR